MKLSKKEKYKILVEEFRKRYDRTLDTYDETLRERLGDVSPKTLDRLINDFMEDYKSVIEVEGRRRKTYKLATPVDIVIETFDHFEDIGWLFQMVYDSDTKVFKELEKYINRDKHIYQFKNTPFEDINDIESKQSFKRLKNIIEARDYAKLAFANGDVLDNLKCLKLVFMENNWYVAYVNTDDELRLGRISFIERIDYGTRMGHFQPSSVQKHLDFLEKDLQNTMTLYGKEWQKATLQALPPIAKYFQEGMKKFFPSQKFVKELDDGSVIFTVEYTRELEILPFIQKWMPDLIILEPQSLKDAYIEKLQKALENLS